MPDCQDALSHDYNPPRTPREWEQWLATTRKTIITVVTPQEGTPDQHEPRLIDADCHSRSHPALMPAYEPPGPA